MKKPATLILGAMLIGAAGCAGSADICAVAEAHIERCTGMSAPAQAGACSEEAANAVLATSCENLLDGTRNASFFGDLFSWLSGGGNKSSGSGVPEPDPEPGPEPGGEQPKSDPPPPPPQSQCAIKGGTCQWHSTPCKGQYNGGLCPGPSTFLCCLPQPDPPPPPQNTAYGSWCETPDGACVVHPPQPLKSICHCGYVHQPGVITK